MDAAQQIIILGVLGSASGSPVGPTAPVLSLISEVAGLVSLQFVVDDTVVAGDTLRRQVRVNGLPDWTVLVDNTDHVISPGEDTANTITPSLTLPNGTYDIRGFIIRASDSVPSGSSNVLTITISDAASRWQLEDASGFWQLEDASGNWILEA